MHKKITGTIALGFVFGLGLASCASQESHRSVASDVSPREGGAERPALKAECRIGEERNEAGDCVRPHDFDRPFRRSGR